MKTKIVQIGNSRGIRLPKPLLDQAGLDEEVELDVRDGEIVIRRITSPRHGWAKAAQNMATHGDDAMLDPPVPTHFDEEEWEW